MVVLGGLVGGLVGFIVQLVFTEWLYVDTFAERGLEEILISATLVGLGAFAGTRVARRVTERRHVSPAP